MRVYMREDRHPRRGRLANFGRLRGLIVISSDMHTETGHQKSDSVFALAGRKVPTILTSSQRSDFFPQILRMERNLKNHNLNLSSTWFLHSQAQEWMDSALSVLSVVAQGARSNLWGLGCPFYCGTFPLSAFLCSFLVGWLLGLLSAALAWIYLFHHTPSSIGTSLVPTTVIHPRLAGYLHERGLSSRRHHWHHFWISWPHHHSLWSSSAGCSVCWGHFASRWFPSA